MLLQADLTQIATNCFKFNGAEEGNDQEQGEEEEPNEYVESARKLLTDIGAQCEGLWECILERSQKQGRRR
jgi:hypothetical protein